MTETFVRFAPSPTGHLHVGNVRTALANWLFARQMGGRFLLRIDDTDRERSKPEYEEAIQADLAWLGLGWDVYAKQSDRMSEYDAAKEKLIADGRLYACYDTPEELEIKRKMLASRGLPPIYDRSGLKLSEADKQKYEAEGRTPHWRFLLNDAPIEWEDLIRGKVRFEAKNLADPVLWREDGVPLFTLSTSVDDGQMGITHILRGEDHVSNTALQVQIMEALGYAPPRFGHMALLQMKGNKISKREGGGDIASLRDEGNFPLAVCSYLAKIGTSDAIALADDMAALIAAFDTAKFGRSMANYDAEELQRLNEKMLRGMSCEEFRNYLPNEYQKQQCTPEIWDVVRPNMMKISDFEKWHVIISSGVIVSDSYLDENSDYLRNAAAVLPEGELDSSSWGIWIERIKQQTGRKGKELFMPLRKAITGMFEGPELEHVLPVVGREKILQRLLRQ